jgi:hypothetical protein
MIVAYIHSPKSIQLVHLSNNANQIPKKEHDCSLHTHKKSIRLVCLHNANQIPKG